MYKSSVFLCDYLTNNRKTLDVKKLSLCLLMKAYHLAVGVLVYPNKQKKKQRTITDFVDRTNKLHAFLHFACQCHKNHQPVAPPPIVAMYLWTRPIAADTSRFISNLLLFPRDSLTFNWHESRHIAASVELDVKTRYHHHHCYDYHRTT